MPRFYCENEISRPHSPLLREPCLSLLLLLFIYACLKILTLRHASITYCGDDTVFWDIAKVPLSYKFFTAYRPFTVPLIYKIFSRNEMIVACFQIILSIFSWFFLVQILRFFFKTSLGQAIVSVGLLLLSCAYHLTMWDMVIRSESISISLFAIWLGCTLWLFQKYSTHSLPLTKLVSDLLIWSVISILWSFCRDTHSYILLALAIILLFVLFLKKRPNRISYIFFGGIILVSLAIFAIQKITFELGNRMAFPLTNIFCMRIIPDDKKLEYFVKQGMPYTSAIKDYIAVNQKNDKYDIQAKPLEPFRPWLTQQGAKLYQQFLLANLGSAWAEVMNNFPLLVHQNLEIYGPTSSKLSNTLDHIFLPISLNSAFMIFFSIIFCGLLSPYIISAPHPLWWTPPMLLLFCLSQAFVCYHGDASEVGRHALLVKILLYLAWWMTLFICADYFIAKLLKDCPQQSVSKPKSAIHELMLLLKNAQLIFRQKTEKKRYLPVLILLFCCCLFQKSQPIRRQLPFTEFPPDFNEAKGKWHIENDILRNKEDYSVFLFGEKWWRNFQITVRFIDLTHGGIFFRSQDHRNSYVFMVSPNLGEAYWLIRQEVNGKREYNRVRLENPAHREITVQLKIFENSFLAYIDNQLVTALTDNTYNEGQAGILFCCQAGQGVDFFEILSPGN